jgi:hypothetical protein
MSQLYEIHECPCSGRRLHVWYTAWQHQRMSFASRLFTNVKLPLHVAGPILGMLFHLVHFAPRPGTTACLSDIDARILPWQAAARRSGAKIGKGRRLSGSHHRPHARVLHSECQMDAESIQLHHSKESG